MAKENPIILSFADGELSPFLDARSDIKKYYSGCQSLENMYPMVEGPAARTPGTYFINEVKTSADTTRIIPFQQSPTEGFHIEMGDEYFRFYKDGVRLTIDDSMDDFDPSEDYFVGEYTKVGNYRTLNCDGAGKILNVSALHDQVTTGITIACVSAGIDTMTVTNVAGAVTINLANGTATKNAANLIQVALRALGTIAGVSLAGWFVTENTTYAAARPTVGINVAGAALSVPTHNFYQCNVLTSASATNTCDFPVTSIGDFSLVVEGNPVEIKSPYDKTHLFGIKTARAIDVMYLYHPTYAVRKLEYIDTIQWKLLTPTLYFGKTKHIRHVSKANPGRVGTTRRHFLEDGDQVYIEDVEGMTELNGNTYTITTDGRYHFTIGVDTSGYTTYTDEGTCAKILAHSTGDYPSCGAFYEQRHVIGGSDNDPQTLHFSETGSGNYEVFTLNAEEEDAGIEYTIASESDRIRWMMANSDNLFSGTSGGVWKISATNSDEPITQLNISIKKQINFGVKDIEAEMIGNSLVWATKSGLSVQQIKYFLESDSWDAKDLTKLAKHITIGSTQALSGVKDFDFQKEPRPILWAVLEDGSIIGMTHAPEEEVYGWFKLVTDGEVEAISITTKDESEDDVMMLVKRTINGADVRYIERMMPFNFFSILKDCFFVHSGLTWDGGADIDITGITAASPPVVTAAGHTLSNGNKVRIKDVVGMTEVNIGLTKAYTVANSNTGAGTFELSGIDGTGWTAYTSGGTVTKVANSITLAHLVGETVDIVVDGAVHPQETVGAAGATSLDYYGNLIHAGLPYTSILSPMKIHAAAQIGSARGQKKKVHKMIVSFYETVSAKSGTDLDDLKIIPFGTGDQPTLFTGDKVVPMNSGWNDEISLYLVQDQPMPMTVVCMVPAVTLNEEF